MFVYRHVQIKIADINLPEIYAPNQKSRFSFFFWVSENLGSAVATVDDEIGPGSVGGSIGGKVEVGTLQLVGLALTAHGDLVAPDILGILGHKAGDLSGNVTGGYSVGASVADPFDRKRLAWEGVSRVIKLMLFE